MVDKAINKEYQNVIDICKLLKPHATTALLVENGLVITQPIIEGIRNYMILDNPAAYPRFNNLYINVSEIASYHTKFKKTMTDIDWESSNGETFMVLTNPDMDPYRVHILTDTETIEDLINREYQSVPGWKEDPASILTNDPDEMFTKLPDDIPLNLSLKRMCEISVGGHQYRIMISRPFLGDTKNTQWLGYRVIAEDAGEKGRITLKFKQKEKLGNIFTYASFLKIKREE